MENTPKATQAATPTIDPHTGKACWLIKTEKRNEKDFVLAMPNMPMESGNFWDINRPYILRYEEPAAIECFYLVRPGREAADADALDALLKASGPRTDTEINHQIDKDGKAYTSRIIAMLPCECESEVTNG